MNSSLAAEEIKRLVNEAVYHRKKKKLRIKDILDQTGIGGASWYSWTEGKCYPSMYGFLTFLNAMGLTLKIESLKREGS